MALPNDSQHTLQGQEDDIAHEAIQARYDNPSTVRFRRVASKTVVSFGPDDPSNPVNWSEKMKFYVLTTGMMQVLNSTIGSSLPSGAISYIAEDFNITNQEDLVLPISLFLVGYVVGPLFWGPLSEFYGRKRPLLITFILFNIFTLACAVARTFTSFLIFRLFNGIMASAPIAIVGGLYADVHNDPTKRGRTMAYFMACTTFGPIVGPWVSGFVSVVSWRWSFWIGLICGGITLPLLVFIPETYAPVILQRRAKMLRIETGNNSIVAPLDLENRDLKQALKVTLTRPVRMMIYESIVSFTCLYLSVAYAIFYLYFQAYPIIFQGIYGMSTGVAGLCFLPIGVGAFIACGIFLWYDSFLAKAKARGAKWSEIEEYRRLPLACVGGPLYVVSLFWIGWTASPNIHWAVPMVSGIIFGIGYMLIFMAMINYLADAYETFAASAQSAASCCRSIFGAVLPLAAKPMFNNLGVHWACSLMAFLSLGLSIVPFVFIRYGDRIRANSQFCQYLQQLKEAERRQQEQDALDDARRDIEKAPTSTAQPNAEASAPASTPADNDIEKQINA
ncbi:major facilitator superfamily domain-containing protein [Thermoascus aurantiacus ATCC 26904]